MKPSNFCKHPYGSILQNSESESIACNIMVILARNSDTWRELSWTEYKGGGFRDYLEKPYFEKVVKHTVNEEQARNFSPAWNK